MPTETVLKPFLTLREFADYIGRSYSTVWDWASAGRIETEKKEGAGGKTSYRVSRDAAEKAKQKLEDGLWV